MTQTHITITLAPRKNRPVLDWRHWRVMASETARQYLARQIAEAKAEAPNVPLYRGGWP